MVTLTRGLLRSEAANARCLLGAVRRTESGAVVYHEFSFENPTVTAERFERHALRLKVLADIEIERLHAVCALAQERGFGPVGVNIAAGLLDERFAHAFGEAIDEVGRTVVVEIGPGETELEQTGELAAAVAVLRAHGAIIAVDDFGRGASTPQRVEQLRPALVKLAPDMFNALNISQLLPLATSVPWLTGRVVATGVGDLLLLAAVCRLGFTFAQGDVLDPAGLDWCGADTERRAGVVAPPEPCPSRVAV